MALAKRKPSLPPKPLVATRDKKPLPVKEEEPRRQRVRRSASFDDPNDAYKEWLQKKDGKPVKVYEVLFRSTYLKSVQVHTTSPEDARKTVEMEIGENKRAGRWMVNWDQHKHTVEVLGVSEVDS